MKGFTLIELLIVMSIIAVIAGLSLFALGGTRETARDGRRKADLESIALALEVYKADCNYYPTNLPAVGQQLTGSDCETPNANVYMEAIPDDPDAARDYVYESIDCTNPHFSSCRRFRIWAALEAQPTPTLAPDCPGESDLNCRTEVCNYCVHNP